jgi:exodeoxyribonuclease VII small subunit
MGKKKKSDEKQSSFEEMLGRLEAIAGELESGELPLEKAIERYEEGVTCYRECHRILTSAEKKVEILTKNADGELVAEPFEEEEAEGSADEDEEEKKEEKDSKDGTLPF